METNFIIDNHSGLKKLSPEESMTPRAGDNDSMIVSRAIYAKEVSEELETLSSLDVDSMSFSGQDVVEVTLSAHRGAKPKLARLPIKSISAKAMRKIERDYRQALNLIPHRFNAETKEWERNFQSTEFMAFQEQNELMLMEIKYDKLLHGLAIPIMVDGAPVWSEQTYKYDRNAAIDALNQMGITEHQIDHIVDAIEKLSGAVEAESDEQFEKK